MVARAEAKADIPYDVSAVADSDVALEPMGIVDSGRHVRNLASSCHPLQYLRELVCNAWEANASTVVIEPAWPLLADNKLLGKKPAYKLAVIDDGCGMTAREQQKNFNNIAATGHDYTAHDNRGIGAEPRGRGRPAVGDNPHTADELIRVPGIPLEHGFAVRSSETYVRGKVRHRDHETVSFGTWRKVLRNNEASTSGSMGGGRWID